MPKAARRTSCPRVEPYPTIKPGDTVSSRSSIGSATAISSDSKSTKKSGPKTASEKASGTPRKALEEQSKNEINVSANASKPEDKKSAEPKKAASKPSKKAASVNKSDQPDAKNFLEIHLDGEDNDSVPLYDTCSTLRTKITALLGKDNLKPENANPLELKKDGTGKPYTKASFARTINCSTRVLDTFMKAKQMMGGAESAAYPGAYMFFEKKRLWEGKAKGKKREGVEEDTGKRGLQKVDPNNVRVLCGPGEHPSMFLNKYGQ